MAYANRTTTTATAYRPDLWHPGRPPFARLDKARRPKSGEYCGLCSPTSRAGMPAAPGRSQLPRLRTGTGAPSISTIAHFPGCSRIFSVLTFLFLFGTSFLSFSGDDRVKVGCNRSGEGGYLDTYPVA